MTLFSILFVGAALVVLLSITAEEVLDRRKSRRLARASVLRRIENYPSPVSDKWWCPNHGYGCRSCNE